MATYYRISSIGDALPKSWSYADAYHVVVHDADTVEVVDNTSPGAQVWSTSADVLAALMGLRDGMFRPQDGYDRILIIEATGTVDGGDWSAVLPGQVESMRSLPVDGLIDDLEGQINPDDEDDFDLGDWLDSVGGDDALRLDAMLMARSESAAVVWVDTLPQPPMHMIPGW